MRIPGLDSVHGYGGYRIGAVKSESVMRRLILALLAAVTPSIASAQLSGISDKLLAEYRSVFEAGDVGGLVELFQPDGELVDGASAAVGRPAIKALYEAAFAAGMSGSRLQTRIDRDRQLTPALRLVRGVSRITPKDPTQSFCGRFVAAIGMQAGKWRIISFSEATLACGKAFP